MVGKVEHRFADGIELKRCAGCAGWLPLEAFRGDASRWDRLASRCRVCCARAGKELQELGEGGEPSKRCERCGLWLPLRKFAIDGRCWDRRSKRCEECTGRPARRRLGSQTTVRLKHWGEK
jgi:hypothetical protein